MGLWDILVPTEPGVLHNLIANPSFEFNNATVYGQTTNPTGFQNGTTNGLAYWTASAGTTMTRSSKWASQGTYSLKIAAGTVGSEKSVSYNPRATILSAPSLSDITISTASAPPSGYTATIPNGKSVTIAVMALNDVGMNLANNVTDIQNQYIYAYPNSSIAHPTIDGRRGHTEPVFCSPVTTVLGNSIKVSIKDTSTTIESRPRGWAVWYSYTDTGSTTLMFVLAAVIPNIYDGASTTSIGSTTVIDILNIFLPISIPTTRPETGKISTSFTSNTTIFGNGTNFSSADVGKTIYILSNDSQYVYIGRIATYVSSTQITMENNTLATQLLNAEFYLTNETNPQSFEDNTQGGVSSFVYDTIAPIRIFGPLGLNSTAPYFGITNSAYGGFTKKHHLYLDWSISSPNTSNPNASYNDTGANWSVYLINNSVSNPSTTLLGTLDVSSATSSAASRMELRKKFLITRLSGDTSDMSIKIKYTGGNASTDADLYIDGVQFVDVGMIWRAYDWYNSTVTTYNTPLHFGDWDWDVVDFTYVDGDSPGAIWSDTMPTQSGTYTASFPYFLNSGIWHVNPNEYGTLTSAGGYASPRFRQQFQWRNESSPVYGVSIPGLSQSSLQIQSTSLGFWVSLSTSNINVVVEPSTSGVGMPEIATTALEYGIIDGGFIQRQVSRMRTMQFTITISANSWLNLHASRRSFINLLKFDQLAQQGDRMLRYTGGGTPVVTSVTYQSGLDFNGVAQNASFTEVIQLRFLSADPYFYTQTSFVQDISPTAYNTDSSHIMYRLGNTAEWIPLSRHTSYEATGATYFYDSLGKPNSPNDIGWISSPSGNISALVVGGQFVKSFNIIAFFTVSGFAQQNTDTLPNYTRITTTGTLTSNTSSATVTNTTAIFTSQHVGALLFISVSGTQTTSAFIGIIQTVNSSTNVTLTTNAARTFVGTGWRLYTSATKSYTTPQNSVFGKQQFEFQTNGVGEVIGVNSILQETTRSVVVVGQFESVVELGTSFSGRVSTVRTYDALSTSASKYQYTRAVRFVMTDAGRIIAQPIDQIASGTSSYSGYKSNLYNLLHYTDNTTNVAVNTRINGIATTANNAYFFATGSQTQQTGNTYDSSFPQIVSRSANAFAKESINSSIVYQDNSFNTNFVGIRLTSRALGTISYSATAPNSLLITGVGTSFISTSSASNPNIPFWGGKSIFTAGGIYIGQIFYVISSTTLLLCEPPPFTFTNIEFEISLSADSVIVDNKTQKNTVYASLVASDTPTLSWNTYVWAYINSPIAVGGASIVNGSRSIGTPPGLNGTLGIDNSGQINLANTSSTAVNGVNTNFNTSMINNFILTSTNQIIGKIASITNTTNLNLYENSVTTVSTPTAFVIRPTRYFSNSSGYQTTGGTILSSNDSVVKTNFESTTTIGTYSSLAPAYTNLTSFVGTSPVNPFMFTDTTQKKAFLQTSTNLTGQILRRFATSGYNINANTLTPSYIAGSGVGYVSNGAINANLVKGNGSVTQSVNAGQITITVTNGLFQQTDVMRAIYAYDGTNYQFVGVILAVFSNTQIQLNYVLYALSGSYYLSGVAVVAGTGTITSIDINPLVSGYVSITTGTKAVTSSFASFAAGDVGKDIYYSSAGSYIFIGRIALFISTTSVALVDNYTGTTLSGEAFYFNIYLVTGSGTAFTALDIGRNLYDSSGQLIGIIGKYYSATSVALASVPLIFILTSGLSYGLSVPLYFYQFPLYSSTFTAGANTFASIGMLNGIDIASGTTTAITLNYAPMWASQTTPVPYAYAAYAYINYTNQWLGEITSYVSTITNTFSTATANASTITVTANTKTVTALAASFVAGDVGKSIYYFSTTGIYLLLGVIATFTSTTVVQLVDTYTGATLSGRGFTITNSANITGVSAGNPFTQSDIGRKLYATVASVYTYVGTISTVTANTGAGTVMATLTANAAVAIIGQSLIFGNSSITISGGTAFAIPAFTPISIMPYTTIDTSAVISTTGESIYKVGSELISDDINGYSGYVGTIAKIKSTYALGTGTISVALNGTAVTGVGTSFAVTDTGRILYNATGAVIGTIGAFTSTTSVTLVSGALVAVTTGTFNISNNQIIFSYIPYQTSGQGTLTAESSTVFWNKLMYTSAKSLRGSSIGDYWADVIGYVSAQSASIMNVTTTALLADTPSTILPNINLSINTTKNTQQFTATAGVNYLTIATTTGATNVTLTVGSASGTLVTDTSSHLLAGRPIFTNATPAVYAGTVKLATSSTAITLEQNARVAIATTTYKTTAMSFKYGLAPGDVIRHTDGRLIGQVKSIDIANLRVYLTDNAIITYTGQVLIQRGLGLGLGIGTITAFDVSVGTVTGNTGVTNFTLFSQLPLNYIQSGGLANVNIRIYLNKNNTLVNLGNVTSVSSDSSMVVSSSIPSFTSQSYEWYYLLEYTAPINVNSSLYYVFQNPISLNLEYPSIPWMAGLGVITGVVANSSFSIGVVTGIAAASATVAATRFVDQLYPGVTMLIYSSAGALALTGIVTKVTSNSSVTISIQSFDSTTYTTGSLPNGTYYWHYVVTPNETISTTTGDNAFISNDWQPLGKQDGYVNVIKNTINGDIFVGGKFSKWSDKSQSLLTPTVWRNVYNIAKLVISIAGDTITEAYATPIVGTSYTRNGISGEVNDLEDVSEINPINGYVGSGDKLIVGGDFYATLNNEILLPGLGYIEGNTMTNSMRPVINTEVEPLLLNNNPGVVYKIAVTNRLRPYNGLINTNTLDGINGSNIAVLFTDPVYAKTKMQFTSVRVRGNASTYPVITVVNPTANILSLFSLYQTETGARLLFVNSKISLAPNERIVIDLRIGKRSIISNIRGNVISYLNPLSNFVDWILIGANSAAGVNTQSTDDYHLNVVGVHADYGITVTISYTPRFWSFDTNDMFFGTTKAGL
jgi:hypothetical protein